MGGLYVCLDSGALRFCSLDRRLAAEFCAAREPGRGRLVRRLPLDAEFAAQVGEWDAEERASALGGSPGLEEGGPPDEPTEHAACAYVCFEFFSDALFFCTLDREKAMAICENRWVSHEEPAFAYKVPLDVEFEAQLGDPRALCEVIGDPSHIYESSAAPREKMR